MEEYKWVNKIKNKKEKKNKGKGFLYSFFNKMLIASIIFMVLLITVKANPKLKDSIYQKVYENTFSFAKINDLYKKYFGNVLPFDNIVPNDEVLVFNEKIIYTDISLYKDGAKLQVSNNYLVPTIESGIIVFIGEKENYGKTIIVQQVNGIDVWYGNITNTGLKLYDYVQKGSLLGEAIGKNLYLVFQKEGKFLNYKEYL